MPSCLETTILDRENASNWNRKARNPNGYPQQTQHPPAISHRTPNERQAHPTPAAPLQTPHRIQPRGGPAPRTLRDPHRLHRTPRPPPAPHRNRLVPPHHLGVERILPLLSQRVRAPAAPPEEEDGADPEDIWGRGGSPSGADRLDDRSVDSGASSRGCSGIILGGAGRRGWPSC